MILAAPNSLTTRIHRLGNTCEAQLPNLQHFPNTTASPSQNLTWVKVINQTFGHRTYVIEAQRQNKTIGILPLAEMNSILFGKHLVSLPYVNLCGVQTNDPLAAEALVDDAVALADELDVRYLELRHSSELAHPALHEKLTSKTIMQLALPDSADELWSQFKSKLRSQIRKGRDYEFSVQFGRFEFLDCFYKVFSKKMRDLGTPVYSKRLFECILNQFPDSAEICCVFAGPEPIASALLVHGNGITEVPSASSLTAFNSKNANMLMYWHLLKRTIERGNRVFDFGRSTIDSSTFRFKKQWGAKPQPSVWQYYVRKGTSLELRPENSKYSIAINAWRRMPIPLTLLLGPMIVRGIP